MDGSMVSGIQLKVTLARRQPQIEPINDASSSAAWATLGNYNTLGIKLTIIRNTIIERTMEQV